MYETAYVHGVGAVTSYGWGSESLWEGLKSQMPAPQYHTGLGGRFPDPCWFASVPDGGDPSRGSSRYLRGTAHAINEAIASAKKRGWTPGDRVGIVHATTRGDLELIRRRYLEFESVKPRRAYVESSWTTPSGLAMIEHGFTGPAVVASAACSSGGHALAVAHRLLACGDATDVIVVASDIGFDGEEITFFASLGPLHYDRQSTEVCRPFQEGSEGFVLGEAAAAIVLSAGAAGSPHASLLASELGNDHHHPVSIEPSGVEIQRTIDRALQRARIDRSGVEHYSAHGTGTAEC